MNRIQACTTKTTCRLSSNRLQQTKSKSREGGLDHSKKMKAGSPAKLIVDVLLQRFLPLARRRIETAQAQACTTKTTCRLSSNRLQQTKSKSRVFYLHPSSLLHAPHQNLHG
ncbi:hypothetical protein K2173_020255 [Erythroxylum novogranatense]|uniref:Uncharacterized protein n=1 Tax=Erythroxylum novogranatense TaxID=1862640 RepID=A0AAV8U7H8_9ROSI|nr:hypothetical protein K2173_020255 [Erythroxylum novogranatense]